MRPSGLFCCYNCFCSLFVCFKVSLAKNLRLHLFRLQNLKSDTSFNLQYKWWTWEIKFLYTFTIVVQLLSHIRFFATPWTAALQASLSFTISQSLLKLTSIESMMPSNHLLLLQEGGPLPGPETGLLSNTQKWIVTWGDTCADKARDFIEKGHPGGEQEGKGIQENCSASWLTVLGFMVMGLVSSWSLANHSNSESFLVVHTSAQTGWMLARGILGSRRTLSVSFPPFPISSGWWWLISSVFLIRTSCQKTTHANGYYGAWPGWVVSISMLPLTLPLIYLISG